MNQLDHPNIIKLYEVFEDNINISLVLQYCDGGDVYKRLIEKNFFPEDQARKFFIQIMQAISYLHN